MNFLVLGPTGQLGRAFLSLAEAERVPALGVGRDAIDLARTDAIRPTLATRDFDVLINCAAFTRVDAAESEAGSAFAVNAYAVEQIALACADRDARLVQVSTDYVFDGEADRPYQVSDPPSPINVYGASKLAGEALARRANPGGTLVVRTSSVFGRGANFVETMIRVARERGRPRVVDDVAMAPTFADDLARAILDLVRGDAPAGTYHVTNAGQTTWHGFAAAILERAGPGAAPEAIPSADYPTPARRPRFSVLDTSSSEPWTGGLPHWTEALDRYLAARE